MTEITPVDQNYLTENDILQRDNLNVLLYPFSKMEKLPLPSSDNKKKENDTGEPLLVPDEGRYVMFPIKHNDVWNMYKKQMDSFWRCEEINMSKDLMEWEKMNEDEKYFIKMVLAFFAASDGIVLENLAQRFMSDIENSEIRAFYSMQIFMENIHCVSADTLILTSKGYLKIGDLSYTDVEVWNGEEFTPVTVRYTGNQELYRVTLSNGIELDCTGGHKWILYDGETRVTTMDLIENQTGDSTYLAEFKYPYLSTSTNYDSGELDDSIDSVDIDEMIPPINSLIYVKRKWLNGILNVHSEIYDLDFKEYLCFQSTDRTFLKNLQLFFSTLGIATQVFHTAISFVLILVLDHVNYDILHEMGIDFNLIDNTPKESGFISNEILRMTNESAVKVVNIEKISENSPTFCFNEPKKHAGVFNGVLTGQSEMYSILIDTYSRDKSEKDQLFNAILHFPCIKKKAEWAKKWINDRDSTFASRLIAFAIVEGIFFSSSFASIYWIKKRGMLHGLTLSNEFISRDEALHVEFAVLLYHKLIHKLDKDTFYKIMTEAVEIEKEFILEAIPCRLIGMNSALMSQYIEFVSNRLCLQLGYDKLFPNATNPFDFMELISLNDKVNFFEKTNTQYALANKVIEGDPFDLTSDF